MGQGSSELQAVERQVAELWRVVNRHGLLIEGLREAAAGQAIPSSPGQEQAQPAERAERPATVSRRRGSV